MFKEVMNWWKNMCKCPYEPKAGAKCPGMVGGTWATDYLSEGCIGCPCWEGGPAMSEKQYIERGISEDNV